MARSNLCKECGVGPDLPEGVSWVGTNHNLCSVCVGGRERKRAEARMQADLEYRAAAEARRAAMTPEEREAADRRLASARKSRTAVAVAMAAAFGGFR